MVTRQKNLREGLYMILCPGIVLTMHSTEELKNLNPTLAEMVAAADQTATSNSAESYARFGDDRAVGEWAVVVGRTRDSDHLGNSNFERVQEDLRGMLPEELRREWVIIESASHWAVGWVETLLVRVYDENGEITEVAEEAANIVDALRDYPVYDESDFCEREYNEYQDEVQREVEYLNLSENDEQKVYAWILENAQESSADYACSQVEEAVEALGVSAEEE